MNVPLCCRRCSQPNPDLRLIGCSCLLHARCTPLSLVISNTDPFQYGGIPTPVKSTSLGCPVCKNGTVSGIHLFPMSFQDLDRAIELRKQDAKGSSSSTSGQKRFRDDGDADDALMQQIQVESSYILLSHTRSNDRHQNDRTGRWSTEEVNYCDALVAGFDQGSLPLPHGVKLNEFLGDMLLCKSSRLTKKMKNAKLSTRSYTLQNASNPLTRDFCESLSAYQAKFIQSISSEPMQLEIQFNMTKLWRTHFSNLCLQVGYDLLDASDWLASLEEMERRASSADDLLRKARRRRMGLALKQDGESAKAGVFIAGVPIRASMPPRENVAVPTPVTSSSNVVDNIPSMQEVAIQVAAMQPPVIDVAHKKPAHSNLKQTEDAAFLSAVLNLGDGVESKHIRNMSDDFSIGIEDFLDPISMMNNPSFGNSNLGDCGPFLERVIRYLERTNAPFQHVDVWVPSYLPTDGDQNQLRLFHAGHATRSDIDAGLSYQLHEYGIYSKNFSFAPGVGLPGRVYSTGKPSWEGKVHNADPSQFERSGGARVYGVITAVGIPLEAPTVGRIILALYSTKEIPENEAQLQRFLIDFAKWTPEPKWKLVIELGDDDVDKKLNQMNSAAEVSRSSRAMSNTSSMNSDASRSSSASSLDSDDIEQRIATLLGDYMPMMEGNGSNSIAPHFMSLRLLLLRCEDRRTNEQKDLLDVVKKSYKGYSKDNRRSEAELASLLVRDWIFLSASNPQISQGTSSSPVYGAINSQQHHCHVMSPTNHSKSTVGVPTAMPSTLGLLQPAHAGQQMHLLSQQQRHISYPSGRSESSALVHHRHSFDERVTESNSKSIPADSRGISPDVVPQT